MSTTTDKLPHTKHALNVGVWIAIGAGLGAAPGAALDKIAVWTAAGAGFPQQSSPDL